MHSNFASATPLNPSSNLAPEGYEASGGNESAHPSNNSPEGYEASGGNLASSLFSPASPNMAHPAQRLTGIQIECIINNGT